MPRFTNTEYRSLNESISHVTNPALALAEAEEYAALLEEVITTLCAELEIDPQELVEDIQTSERYQEMRIKGVKARSDAERVRGRRDAAARKIRKAAADHDKQNSKEQRSKAVYAKGGRKITDPKEGKREMKASEKRFRAHLDREFKKGAAENAARRAKMSDYERAVDDAEHEGYHMGGKQWRLRTKGWDPKTKTRMSGTASDWRKTADTEHGKANWGGIMKMNKGGLMNMKWGSGNQTQKQRKVSKK